MSIEEHKCDQCGMAVELCSMAWAAAKYMLGKKATSKEIGEEATHNRSLITKEIKQARIDELKMARSVDSQFSSADIVEHLENRLTKLNKERV